MGSDPLGIAGMVTQAVRKTCELTETAILMREVLKRLDIPVHPEFERMLGYRRNDQWVAFHGTPESGDLNFFDGFGTGPVTNQEAWLAFVNHERVAKDLQDYVFGAFRQEGTHWLVLNRNERRFYVGSNEAVLEAIVRRRLFREDEDDPIGGDDPVGFVQDVLDSLEEKEDRHRKLSDDESIARNLQAQKDVRTLKYWLNDRYLQ